MSRRADVLAAGAIVWRLNGRTLEVLLVHRPSYDDWSIPKGKLNNGEDIQVAAVREVEEETGIAISLGQPLGKVSYRLGDGRKKTTHYWAAQPLSINTKVYKSRPRVKPAKESEIDEKRWIPTRLAYQMLAHESDRELLGKLIDQYSDGKLKTWPLLVARHTRAMKRSAWKGGSGTEATRPLTPIGEKHARELVPLLAAYGVTRVVSSPWERCVATMRPYAKALRTEIEMYDELTEASHESKPKVVDKLVDFMVRRNEASAVICVHRPTLPTIVAALENRAQYSIIKQVPKTDPWLRTGEVLVAHVARRRGHSATIVSLEKVRPSVLG
ncbi:NUDIX hydrolase [Flaviflexus salsibiostraticola]|uniref:NUDIX hydrolase n=1 Tax=Flaviflexus salsibiostraticola TaxID=1282737 RepID=A0A3S8Z965_9ACTO|nr:NUDIX hydrolase [Flaviflexus salsibiostraticola]AZN30072.1 NUDIX hydrolase [Flaviflexus salsibiostraticola]